MLNSLNINVDVVAVSAFISICYGFYSVCKLFVFVVKKVMSK